jgi:UrcA family protein
MNRSLKLRQLACRLLVCIGLASPAIGGCTLTALRPIPQPQPLASIRVAYSDLDLSREADARTLLERIGQAAYRACGGNPRRHPTYELMPRYTKAVFEECRNDAVTRAVTTISAPALLQILAQLQRTEADDQASREIKQERRSTSLHPRQSDR